MVFLHLSLMNCTTQMTLTLQNFLWPDGCSMLMELDLKRTKDISFYKCTLPCLLRLQSLSLWRIKGRVFGMAGVKGLYCTMMRQQKQLTEWMWI